MRIRNSFITILSAIVLTMGLLDLQQPTLAQSGKSPENFRGKLQQPAETLLGKSNCKRITGQGTQFFDPLTGIVTGPITNSGILDGDLQDVINFGAGFVFTPDPTVVTYTTALTITTIHGQVRVNPVTTQSVVTGKGNEFGDLDPNASTGRFAGATGTIWISFTPVGDPSVGPYEIELTADICFAQ